MPKPLSPSETRALLNSLDHRPVKKLGQNFLIDGNIVRKSLELAEIEAGDRVVEVGPGLGTLTRALLDAQASVYAVEKGSKTGCSPSSARVDLSKAFPPASRRCHKPPSGQPFPWRRSLQNRRQPSLRHIDSLDGIGHRGTFAR